MPESPERSAHSLKLTGRSEVAERTVEFRFEKPQSFDFKAGQFMDLTLVDPPETDGEGNTRAFSINSAPDDPDSVFATRLRDTAFSVCCSQCRSGPWSRGTILGNLTLHNDTRRPVYFLLEGSASRCSWRSSGRSSGATCDSRSCRRSGRGVRARAGTARPYYAAR